MTRPTDYRLDPPDEPELTPIQYLVIAVDVLLAARKREREGGAPAQIDYLLSEVAYARDLMRADELPDYDDPIDAGVPVAAQQAEYEALVSITEEVS